MIDAKAFQVYKFDARRASSRQMRIFTPRAALMGNGVNIAARLEGICAARGSMNLGERLGKKNSGSAIAQPA
jgi:hypothetical protein